MVRSVADRTFQPSCELLAAPVQEVEVRALRLVGVRLGAPLQHRDLMTPITATLDPPPFRRNFGRLVLGFINAEFCNETLTL